MQPYERQVSLRLGVRPLRLVYLVHTREELLTAVKLYSHTWGGSAATILPVPRNEEEANTFKTVLGWLYPDYIFVPVGVESFVPIEKALERHLAQKVVISSDGVNRHINGAEAASLLIGLRGLRYGELPHIGPILSKLYPSPMPSSEIYLVEPHGCFSFELSIHAGFATELYKNYLQQHFGAEVLPAPTTVRGLIQTSLILAVKQSLISLTMLQVSRSQEPIHFYKNSIDYGLGLHLFLDDGQDIDVIAAFWNSRWQRSYNKLLLPKEAFLEGLEDYIGLIAEVIPSLQSVFITTPLDYEDAVALGNRFSQAFKAIGREISVDVFYRNFRFDAFKGTSYWGQERTSTCIISPDNSIRFTPSLPIGHKNSEFIFGYDAEVTLFSGRKLFLPSTPSSAVLLSHHQSRIKDAKEHSLKWENLQRTSSVRPMLGSITGTALPNVECQLCVPQDDEVINQQLEDAGFKLRPNDHTRHARGFIRRFGSLEETISLIDSSGVDIISALSHLRAEQGGLEWNQLISFLTSQRSWTNKKIQALLKPKLQHLLSASLVRRGYSLQCSICEFRDWFSLEEVSEFVKCRACDERFQLPLDKLSFAFKANELALRLVRGGGLAVLMTAAILHQIDYSSFIQFGGDLLAAGEKSNSIEVDVFSLNRSNLTIAECKSENSLGEEKLADIKASLVKTVNLAPKINAKVVILGVVTNSSDLSGLFELMTEVGEEARKKDIGLHLAFNWKFYLWGREEVDEVWKLQPEYLQHDQQQLEEERGVSVGEISKRRTVGDSPFFSKAVLEGWKHEISRLRDSVS
jgi:hypothetical protein